MGTLYVDTGGNAANSGSSDNNSPDLSGSAATVVTTTISLDGSPDLSALVTSGATQSTIYLADATNSNQKIFWITAFDNTAKTVTVSVAPTGVTSSVWNIGGRMVWTPANIEAGLRPGDEIIFNNSPASRTAAFYTGRVSGTGAGGFIKLRGKTGVRPVFNITNTANCIEMNSATHLWLENIEFDQDGATGVAININQTPFMIKDCKISDAGGAGISCSTGNGIIIGCEITGCGSAGILGSGSIGHIINNYIHDVTTHGIQCTGIDATLQIINNIIDSCGGNGILHSGASTGGTSRGTIMGNTIYGCGNSGIEITDADTNIMLLMNNILSENGNAAGEYNVELVAATFEFKGVHFNNIFHHSGGGGGANLFGITANATESTSDPLLTDPANGDFTISSSSPAKGTGFGTFLGSSISYPDMGAVQRQEPASSGVVAHVIGG